jgi:hypothetical protein
VPSQDDRTRLDDEGRGRARDRLQLAAHLDRLGHVDVDREGEVAAGRGLGRHGCRLQSLDRRGHDVGLEDPATRPRRGHRGEVDAQPRAGRRATGDALGRSPSPFDERRGITTSCMSLSSPLDD